MSEPMRIRARLQGDKTQVIVSMSHEMETGQRKDAAGKTVPAWFIQNVSATHNGKTVFSAQFGPAVAKNPNMGFRVAGAKLGDKIAISWVDNRGEKRTDEVTVTPA
jgi:sulfur-oxidizing protein SoxZ